MARGVPIRRGRPPFFDFTQARGRKVMGHETPSRKGGRLIELVVDLALLALIVGFIAYQVDRVQEAAAHVSCNLGGVAHAIHRYNDQHGHLPPAAVTAEDGTPLLSWRVLILPYIEDDKLFKEFRLNEPWDSPHNLALLPRMPRNYEARGWKKSRIPAHHTMLSRLRRRRDAVRAGQEVQDTRRLPPSLDATLLFVEAGEAMPWTKPNALPDSAYKPLPPLRSLFRDGFRSCVIHSTYHDIRTDTPEDELRAMIMR
jgi:hypothetical protein